MNYRGCVLLTALLMGCGGPEFSNRDSITSDSAGAPAMDAGAGTASMPGIGGAPGAGGASDDYTGDSYLALDTTGQYSLVSRGLSGDLSGYLLSITARYHGTGWKLFNVQISVNGAPQGALVDVTDTNNGSDETYAGTTGVYTTGKLDGDKPLGSLTVAPGDLLQVSLYRSTTTGTGEEELVTDITAASLISPDGSVSVALP